MKKGYMRRLITFTTLAALVWLGAAVANEPEIPQPEQTPIPSQTAPAETPAPEVPQEHRLEPGDVVFVEIKEDSSNLTNQYQVDSRGNIILGYAGEVAAEGLTTKELTEKIKKKLEGGFLKTATVYVELRGRQQPRALPTPVGTTLPAVMPERQVVYVMGKVKNPGPVEIPPNEKDFTVSKAIIKAGGYADFAKLSRTKLVRKLPDGKIHEQIVNVYQVIIKGRLDLDVPVEKDDWIIVPQSFGIGPS